MDDLFEQRLMDIVKHFSYPAIPLKKTQPSFAYSRTLARHVATIVLVMGLIAVAIPDIRAAILEVFQIGNVTIYLDGLDTTDEPLRLDDVAGETDIETAQTMLKFEMLVPADQPDRVYVQNENMVILVWLNGETIEKVFYQIRNFDWGIFKSSVSSVIQFEVAGHYGMWLDTPHTIEFLYQDEVRDELTYFVSGNVLIWEAGNITYRLESTLTMEEAITYAESLYQ